MVSDRKFKTNNKNGLADLSIRQVKFSRKSGSFLKAEVEVGNKENNAALRVYASSLFIQGEYAKVFEMRENVLKTNQKQTPCLLLLATSYHRTGNIKNADQMLKELETQSQTNTKPLHAVAVYYAELGRNDEAIIANRVWQIQEMI